MSGHLSADAIRLALQKELPPDQESAFHEHMDSCPTCVSAMEQICGAEQVASEISELLQADELGDLVPGRDEYSATDFVVEHLEASESVEALGRLGDYDILEVIGRGGMGVVLKGYDRQLKRFVAIKALAPHLAHTAIARKRFAREAQAAAAVVNLHVIAIHQVQPNGPLPFLVMPLLSGESLAHRLKTSGTLEVKEILRIGMQAAEGLAAAHAQGLIHRDIKPANILLEKGVERAVLTDFGLARAADDVSLTRQGIIAGTPEYMSPEQARGEALDGRSDLFSLGCVLYEMATGVSPFRTDSTIATLRRIIEVQPPAMASFVPELPPWFCRIVERLLAKDPAQRFDSASEVHRLLEECLAHLQQPASVALPDSLCNKVTEESSYIDAFVVLWRTFGDMLMGRPVRSFDHANLGCANRRSKRTSYSTLWSLVLLPVWFFVFATVIHAVTELFGLFGNNVDGQNLKSQEIARVLVSAFQAFLFGLIAAQFSVPATPQRFLRPLMSLWVMSQYFFARKLAYLFAVWVGQFFSRVPPLLTDEEIASYLSIAVCSAIFYSFAIRREPNQNQQTQASEDAPENQGTTSGSPETTGNGSSPNRTRKRTIVLCATLGLALLGMSIWKLFQLAGNRQAGLEAANSSSEMATPDPAKSESGFGPVIERIIHHSADRQTDYCLDLDSGDFVDVPTDILGLLSNRFGAVTNLGRRDEAINAWAEDSGGDLMLAFTTPDVTLSLYGGMIVFPKLSFAEADARKVKEMAQDALQERKQDGKSLPPLTMFHRHELDRDGAFVFQTREGGIGILQIAGSTEKPRSVKVRYKLLLDGTDDATSMPTASDIQAEETTTESPENNTISAAKELDSLQGTWTVEIIQTMSWPKPKGKGPDKSGQGSEQQWVINGNEIGWNSPAGEEVRLSFMIDPAQSPKHFDVKFLSGPFRGKESQGIYERRGVSGKMLWLCLTDPLLETARPTRFAMDSISRHTLIGLSPAQLQVGTELDTGETENFNRLQPGPATTSGSTTLQQKPMAPMTRVATKPGTYDIKPGLKLVVTQGGKKEYPASEQSVVAELIWQLPEELKPSATYEIVVSDGLPYVIAWQDDGDVLWVNCGSMGSEPDKVTRYLRKLTVRGPGEIDESTVEVGKSEDENAEEQITVPEEIQKAFEDVEMLKPLVLIGHSDWVKGVAFSPDGKQLASASHDTTIKLWDVATGKETLTLKRSADLIDGHTGYVEDVQFTPDGKYLVSAGSSERRIRIWNPVTGRTVHTLNAGEGGGAGELVFSPDGTRLAVAGSTVRIFDMNLDADRGWPVVELDAGKPFSVTFSPDGKRLASVGRDRALRVWNPITSEELLHVQHEDEFYCVKFSPDGERLVTANMQGVNLWDAMTGKPTLTLRGAADHIHVVFSPDGRWLATAGWNKLVKLWDANRGEEVLTLAGHGNNVWALAFSPDGKLLATGSADRTVRIWDVSATTK